MTQDIAVAAILVATLAGILLRPGGRSEAWPAAIGAALMLVAGAAGPGDLAAAARQTADVLLFLLGMMLLSWVADRAGVFAWLAEACAVAARGSAVGLFAAVVALAAVVTAVLSLDTTVIMLTPIVYTLAVRRGLDPLPMLFACVFVANIGSLLLPVSNLTNLLMVHRLGLDFTGFVAVLWLPNLVAVVATGLALAVVFRRRIPRRFAVLGRDFPPVDRWFVVVSGGVALTLGGLFAFGVRDWPLSVPALAGGAALLLAGLARRRLDPAGAVRAVSWPVFVFVVAMTVVVRATERTLLAGVDVRVPSEPLAALWAGAGAATVGSNLINNLPMAVLATSFLPPAGDPAAEALAVGTLIGTNIGPALTTYGSLATILWLAIIRERGVVVTTGQYLRVALLVVPVVLVVTLLAAALSLGALP